MGAVTANTTNTTINFNALSHTSTPVDLNSYLHNSKAQSSILSDVVQKTAKIGADIQGNSSALSDFIRIPLNILRSIEMAVENTGVFQAATTKLSNACRIIGTFQILSSISYLVDGAKESFYATVANVAFVAGGIMDILLLLNEVTLISLDKIGSTISKIPGVGTMVKNGVGLASLTTGVFTLGFAFLGFDAIHRIVNLADGDSVGKCQAWLDLAWAVAEVAAGIFALIATANPVGMIVLGSIATVIGLVGVAYRSYHQGDTKEGDPKIAEKHDAKDKI